MFAADRTRLHTAFCTSKNESLQKVVSWATQLDELEKFRSFRIHKVGDVKIPISQQSLREIIDNTKNCDKLQLTQSQNNVNPTILDASTINDFFVGDASLKAQLSLHIQNAVSQAFQCSLAHLKVNVEIELDKLVICDGEEFYYHNSFNKREIPGSFGTMLLQIPVEGSNGGGALSVFNGNDTIDFCLTENCQSRYHLCILAGINSIQKGKQGYRVYPALKGNTLFVLGDIVWKDSVLPTNIRPELFPEFIQTAHEVNMALKGWQRALERTKREYLPTVMASEIPTCKDQTSSLVKGPLETKQTPLLDAKLTKLEQLSEFLCLPLARDYCQENLYSDCLGCEDFLKLLVLKSVDYIDVRLAILSGARHSFTPSTKEYIGKPGGSNLKIRKCIPIKTVLPPLKTINVNVGTNVIGNLKSQLSCPTFGPETCSFCHNQEPVYNQSTTSSSGQLYFAVFLITPKGFYAWDDRTKFLDWHLEQLVSQVPKALQNKKYGDDKLFHQLLMDTHCVLSSIRNPSFDSAHLRAICPMPSIIKQMLYLFQHLKIQVEHLTNLFIFIASKVECSCGSNNIFLDQHLYGKSINSMIVSLINDQNYGWETWKNFVPLMIKESNFTEKLPVYCNFAKQLFNSGCTIEADEVANIIFAKFLHLKDHLSPQYLLIPCLIELIFLLANQKKMEVSPSTHQLTTYNQSKLNIMLSYYENMDAESFLNHLEYFHSFQNEKIPNYYRIMEDLAKVLVRGKKFENATPEILAKIIKSSLLLDNKTIFNLIWDKMCSCPNMILSDTPRIENQPRLLEFLIFSAHSEDLRAKLLDSLTKVSTAAKTALKVSVESFKELFKSGLNPDQLLLCFLFFSEVESRKDFSDETRACSFCLSVKALNLQAAWSLALKLQAMDNGSLKKKLGFLKIYSSLLERIVCADSKEFAKLGPDVFDEVVNTCLWFANTDLLKFLAERVLVFSRQPYNRSACKLLVIFLKIVGNVMQLYLMKNSYLDSETNNFVLSVKRWLQMIGIIISTRKGEIRQHDKHSV